MSVEVDCGYEGANPSRSDAIERIGRITSGADPYSEDGDGNYKFALSVRATNRADGPEAVTLDVDWQDAEYIADRAFAHIGDGDDWRSVPAAIDGTVARVRHQLPPGVNYVGLCPPMAWSVTTALPGRCRRLATGGRCRATAARAASRGFERGGAAPILVTARSTPTRRRAGSASRG